MDERRSGFPACLGDVARALAVDRKGGLGFALRLVHPGVGSGIDDDRRAALANRFEHVINACDIYIGVAEARYLEPGPVLEVRVTK